MKTGALTESTKWPVTMGERIFNAKNRNRCKLTLYFVFTSRINPYLKTGIIFQNRKLFLAEAYVTMRMIKTFAELGYLCVFRHFYDL
jgi:hypothetical protein